MYIKIIWQRRLLTSMSVCAIYKRDNYEQLMPVIIRHSRVIMRYLLECLYVIYKCYYELFMNDSESESKFN